MPGAVWFVLGLFLGAILGVFLMALMVAARSEDRREKNNPQQAETIKWYRNQIKRAISDLESAYWIDPPVRERIKIVLMYMIEREPK